MRPEPFEKRPPGGFIRLSENFAVFVPNDRPTNAVTKRDWEGVGVQPDIISPVQEALTVAHRLAAELLLNVVSEEERSSLREIVATQLPSS